MYTKSEFIEWLKTQDPKDTYTYVSPSGCVYAQFLKSKGHTDVNVGGHWYQVDGMEDRVTFEPYEMWGVLAETPYTYGSLLERMEKLA